MEYIEPTYRASRFTCPKCGITIEQEWEDLYVCKRKDTKNFVFSKNLNAIDSLDYKKLSVVTCNACKEESLWYEREMLFPKLNNIKIPHESMPKNIKDIYYEAREVYPHSKKAAAALLRLALQLLCKELGEKGENINSDIAYLVSKGLPVKIQQSLDILRIVGNNAVHPGVINFDDDANEISVLFEMINLIVEEGIDKPKKIEEIYSKLPKSALSAIEERTKNIEKKDKNTEKRTNMRK